MEKIELKDLRDEVEAEEEKARRHYICFEGSDWEAVTKAFESSSPKTLAVQILKLAKGTLSGTMAVVKTKPEQQR